jgi:hypothetical protein
MKLIAASTAPITASATIITIGDLGGAGGMSVMPPLYHGWPAAAAIGNMA